MLDIWLHKYIICFCSLPAVTFMATILSCILLLKKVPWRLAVQAVSTIDIQHRLNLNLSQVYNYRVLSINFNLFMIEAFQVILTIRFTNLSVCLSTKYNLGNICKWIFLWMDFFSFCIVLSLFNIISLMNLRSRKCL